jgi:secretion/DNA translocation related TadE-like protein
VTEARDEGSATIWVIGLSALVAVMAVAGLLVAAAADARQRADAAADLGALAGAAAAVRGGDGCAAAAGVVRADGATLTSCVLEPGTVLDLTTAVTVPPALHRLGFSVATARARAGPVTADQALAAPSRAVPSRAAALRRRSTSAGLRYSDSTVTASRPTSVAWDDRPQVRLAAGGNRDGHGAGERFDGHGGAVRQQRDDRGSQRALAPLVRERVRVARGQGRPPGS